MTSSEVQNGVFGVRISRFEPIGFAIRILCRWNTSTGVQKV